MLHKVRNPRTGQSDYQFEAPSFEQLESICQKLRTGQQRWYSSGVSYRIQALQDWKKEVESRQDELIEALTIDTGRKRESILEAQLLSTTIDRWCKIAEEIFVEPAPKTAAIPFIDIHQGLVPYSLVGVISPWNFPLLLSTIDTIPALLAGSAVIVKPSEVTPRFIEVIQSSIEAVPALREAFQYIAGAGQTGADMISTIDLLCFTGSVATGKKVYQSAAQHFIPVYLELGGKDPAVVLGSADLDQASSALLWGSTVNCGHSCLSIERIYVQESIYDAFLDKIVQKAKEVRLAYPELQDGEIGPVMSEQQATIINAHLSDAKERGAKLETGNWACEEKGGGLWCAPTILTNVDHSMKVIQEESFGPIMPIMSFKTKEDAKRLANDTIFGLSASVFAGSWEEAYEFGQELEAGAISVNDAGLTAMIHEGEKNAFKMSGMGSTRMGPAAIKRFMRQKTYLIKKQSMFSPWWFDANTSS